VIPKHYYLMVDTETCGTLENGFVYDLGMAVVDRQQVLLCFILK